MGIITEYFYNSTALAAKISIVEKFCTYPITEQLSKLTEDGISRVILPVCFFNIGDKEPVELDRLKDRISDLLPKIQEDLFNKAFEFRKQYTFDCDDYNQFKKEIEDPGGFYNVHWCGSRECEDRLQNETKATIRCIPLENKAEKGKCLLCGNDSEKRVVIAKAY